MGIQPRTRASDSVVRDSPQKWEPRTGPLRKPTSLPSCNKERGGFSAVERTETKPSRRPVMSTSSCLCTRIPKNGGGSHWTVKESKHKLMHCHVGKFVPRRGGCDEVQKRQTIKDDASLCSSISSVDVNFRSQALHILAWSVRLLQQSHKTLLSVAPRCRATQKRPTSPQPLLSSGSASLARSIPFQRSRQEAMHEALCDQRPSHNLACRREALVRGAGNEERGKGWVADEAAEQTPSSSPSFLSPSLKGRRIAC